MESLIEETSSVADIIITSVKENKDTKANKEENKNSNCDKPDSITGHGAIVAAHYNMLEEKGLTERNQSRIVYLRNFNNWIKSMLINEFLGKIRDSKPAGAPLQVLDMCCGKGGDLFKWRNGKITHLIGVDLAETSVKQCENRFKDIQERMRRDRNFQRCFTAEFFPADCTKERLRSRYKDASINLDLVSCQFSFHYSFESLTQAECMLRNAAECLQPGGYFIGTMPDSNEIMSRLENSGSLSFGNEVYKISFESDNKPYDLFGGKYHFHLEGVVDCPEFLVHFPTLERLAKKYGLQRVKKEKFEDFYNRMRGEGRSLLEKMQALETYPSQSSAVKLVGNESIDYEHAKEHLVEKTSKSYARIGTLSQPEWEAATLYLVFAFEKMDKTWVSDSEFNYTPYKSKTKRVAPNDNEEGEPSRTRQRTSETT